LENKYIRSYVSRGAIGLGRLTVNYFLESKYKLLFSKICVHTIVVAKMHQNIDFRISNLCNISIFNIKHPTTLFNYLFPVSIKFNLYTSLVKYNHAVIIVNMLINYIIDTFLINKYSVINCSYITILLITHILL